MRFHHSFPKCLFRVSFARIATGLAVVLTLVSVDRSTAAGRELLSEHGMKYHLETLSAPRPIRVHILKIDLTRPDIELRMEATPDPDGAGPADSVLTDPRELAVAPEVLAFINTNPWVDVPDEKGETSFRWKPGQEVDTLGLEKSAGTVHSQPTEYPDAVVKFSSDGHVTFGKGNDSADFRDGLNGFQPVVIAGKALVSEDKELHPRTIIGADQDGKTLWLVVVDGRQKGYSEGMDLTELGKLMQGIGCWSATNLDGGGSSVLGLKDANGNLVVTNSPSGTKGSTVNVRPVPCILTVRARLK